MSTGGGLNIVSGQAVPDAGAMPTAHSGGNPPPTQTGPGWAEILEAQHGIIAGWQAGPAGLPRHTIEARLRSGRWQVLQRGVYAAFTGQPGRPSLLWAAVLRAGPGAVLSHHTAAELHSLARSQPGPIHVTVPSSRRVRLSPVPGSGIAVHYSCHLERARHPSRTPPRTRLEETVLDLAEMSRTAEEARDWLIRACSGRFTTTSILLDAMAARPKLRWRSELTAGLADIGGGVHSALEWRYVRRAERPHALPTAERQAVSRVGKRTRYLDNLYRDYSLAVELDGRVAHPAEERWRDISRDNASLAAGLITLRYGWQDVAGDPCRVAAEVAQVLLLRGWTGRPRPCGPGCPVGSFR